MLELNQNLPLTLFFYYTDLFVVRYFMDSLQKSLLTTYLRIFRNLFLALTLGEKANSNALMRRFRESLDTNMEDH